MATLVSTTIKSSGGDYTTVTAWEAAQQGDLVTADEIRRGVCFDFNETGSVTIDGSTTDSTRYMELTVDSSARHAGVYSTSGKFYWTRSTDFSNCLSIADPYFRCSYLQMKHTGATDGGQIGLVTGGTNALIEQCIFAGCAGSSDFSNSGISCNSDSVSYTARNCVSYGANCGYHVGFGSTVTWENCVAVSNRAVGFQSHSSVAAVVKNCYGGGNTTSDYRQGTDTSCAGWTLTTCMSADATSRTGVTNSVAHSTANFINVTGGSEDYHIQASSTLRDAGTDLSGSFTVDIDGQTRSGSWDVGADEIPLVPWMPMKTRLTSYRVRPFAPGLVR